MRRLTRKRREPRELPTVSVNAAALATDFRACTDCICERCGGPIATGDRIVPCKGGAWHRSCSFVLNKEVTAFKRANAERKPKKPPPPVDPRQLSLFDKPGGK